MKKFIVDVTSTVEITVDEKMFTPEFLDDFRKSFYDLDTIEDHVKHLAQLQARELLYGFVEGYGPMDETGIRGESVYTEMEIVSQEPA